MEENILPQQSTEVFTDNSSREFIQKSPVKVDIEKVSIKKPMRIDLGMFLGFILGIIAIIWGLGSISGSKPLASYLCLIAGVVVFPPISYVFKKGFDLELSGPLKWFIFIILIVAASLSSI